MIWEGGGGMVEWWGLDKICNWKQATLYMERKQVVGALQVQ